MAPWLSAAAPLHTLAFCFWRTKNCYEGIQRFGLIWVASESLFVVFLRASWNLPCLASHLPSPNTHTGFEGDRNGLVDVLFRRCCLLRSSSAFARKMYPRESEGAC